MCWLFVTSIGCRRGMGIGWIKLYVFFGLPILSVLQFEGTVCDLCIYALGC